MHPFPSSKGLPLAEIQPRGEVGEGSGGGGQIFVLTEQSVHIITGCSSLTARQLSGIPLVAAQRSVRAWQGVSRPGEMGGSPAFCHLRGQGSLSVDQTAITRSCCFLLKPVLRVESSDAGPVWKNQEPRCKKLVSSPSGRGVYVVERGTKIGEP